MLQDNYKFPPIESLNKVSAMTNELGKKTLSSILDQCGLKLMFAKQKTRIQKMRDLLLLKLLFLLSSLSLVLIIFFFLP